MILADEEYLNVQGSAVVILSELAGIMMQITKDGIVDKTDLLKAVELSQMSREEIRAEAIESFKKHVNDADMPESLREFFAELGRAMSDSDNAESEKKEAGDADEQA